jgi:hypothetical protein
LWLCNTLHTPRHKKETKEDHPLTIQNTQTRKQQAGREDYRMRSKANPERRRLGRAKKERKKKTNLN